MNETKYFLCSEEKTLEESCTNKSKTDQDRDTLVSFSHAG